LDLLNSKHKKGRRKITMKRIYLVLIALVLLAAMVIPAGSIFAADKQPNGKLVLNITYKVTNDEDSGNVGYWALDNYNRHIQVWQLSDGSFYAQGDYEGKWQTFAGAKSPGAGVAQGSDAQGVMNGGWVATFKATSFTGAFGNIGTFDFGGTKADVMLGTYGAGQTGAIAAIDVLNNYFPGYSAFNYISWGWTYKYKNQVWNNNIISTTGDIVIP
jgi:hypothetical protein